MDILDREPLSQAMRDLLDIIWKAGGYRFKHRRTKKDSGLAYQYYCCQDSSKEEESVAEGKRDTRQAERFQCESKLVLRPSLEDRTLSISLHHLYHIPYVDIHLSPAALEFINTRVSAHTPSEIYQALLVSGIPGIQHVAEHQVYYQWLQANSAIWKLTLIRLYPQHPFLKSRKTHMKATLIYLVERVGSLFSVVFQ